MNRQQLQAASKRGIITDKQVEQLLNFATKDETQNEQLSFIRGFGDIFITLGIIFVVVAGAQVDLDLGKLMRIIEGAKQRGFRDKTYDGMTNIGGMSRRKLLEDKISRY